MKLACPAVILVMALLSGCANLNPHIAENAPPPSAPTAATNKSTPGLSPVNPGEVQHQGVAHLALPNDLWERMRKGYAMPNLDQPESEEPGAE